jgi:hypothetical protein
VAKPDVACFDCPNCAAKYKLVRAEADAKTLDRQITSRSCGVPFHGRKGRWYSNTLLWTVRRYGHPPRAWANESRYCHSRARDYVACAPTRPARGSGTNAGATILCKGARRKRVLWEVRCLESVSRPCRDPLLGPTNRRRGKRPCPLINIRLLRYAIRAHGSGKSGERSAFE